MQRHPALSMNPLLTITMNPAVDFGTAVENVFPEHKLRGESKSRDAGGGGINVSRAITEAMPLFATARRFDQLAVHHRNPQHRREHEDSRHESRLARPRGLRAQQQDGDHAGGQRSGEQHITRGASLGGRGRLGALDHDYNLRWGGANRVRIHFSVPTAAKATRPTAEMCSQAEAGTGAVWKRWFMKGA